MFGSLPRALLTSVRLANSLLNKSSALAWLIRRKERPVSLKAAQIGRQYCLNHVRDSSHLQRGLFDEYRKRPKITSLNQTAVLNTFSGIHYFFDVAFSSFFEARESDWGSFRLTKKTFLEVPPRKKRARMPHASSKRNGHEYAPPSSDEKDEKSDSTTEQNSRSKKKKVTAQLRRT